ncbi:MAG: PAS domain S-box protein, partial [Euryarchaeota archaeon]|nr:PAS domain S-box protein [Euryarchaeota archaeon]
MSPEADIVKELRGQENSGTLQSTSSDDSASCVMTQQMLIDTEKKQEIDRDVFKKIFQFSAEAIVLLNRDGILVYANDRLCDWLGYATEEIIGKNFLNLPFLSSDGLEKAKRIFKERMLGKEIPAYELDFYTKNGKKIIGLVHAVALKNEQNVSYQNLVMISDITSQKEAEQKLLENNEKYERLFHSSPDFIAEIDEDGVFLAVNTAMAKSLGCSPESIIGKSYHDILPKDVAEKRFQFGRKVLAEGTIQVCEDERAGRHFYTMFVPCETGAGKKTVQVIAKDITSLKIAKKNLQESEKKYRTLVETLNEGIWVIDPGAITTFVNPRMAEMLGYSVEEMMGKHLFSFMDEQGKKLAAENLDRRKQGVKEQHDFEFIKKDGSRIYALLETSPITDETGTYQGAIAGVQDITERKLIEKTLNYQTNLLENVSDAIIATDLQYNIQYWNKTAEKQYGWTASEVIGHPLEMFIINDYLGCSLDVILQKISQDGYWKGEVTQNRRDGVRSPILSTLSKVINAAGQTTGFIAVNRDITERKQAEDTLKQSKTLLNETGKIAHVGGWEFDIITKEQVWTDEVYHIHEVDLTYKLTVKKGIDFYTPASTPIIEKAVQRAMEYGEPFDVELEIITAKGNLRYVRAIGKADRTHGKIYGTFQDITDRKKAEDDIRFLKEYNENILESNPNPMMVVKGTQIEYVNKSFVSIFGETKNEYVARNLKDVIPSESLPVFENMLQEDGVAKELKFRGKDFIVHSFVIKKAEEEEEEEERKGIIFQDITERKQSENKIKESELRFAVAIEGTGAGIWDWDILKNEVVFSVQWKNMLGYRDDEVENSFAGWKNLWHPDDVARIEKSVSDHMAGLTEKYEIIHRCRHKDGNWRWIITRGKILKDSSGTPYRWIGTNIDITERKQAEDALRKSNELFSLFIHHSPIYTYIKEVTPTQGVVLQASDNFRQMIGIPGSEMIGKNMSELFPVELAKKMIADYWAVASTGDVLRLDEDMNGRKYTTIK